MSDSLSQALKSAKDQTERAAIVAEAAFALLPEATALVARRCVILHWFDQLIVEALLEDSELTLDEIDQVYEQLATLPFIDSIPWGLAFQNVTREGLIKRYSSNQPDLLQTAARIVAPAYEMREEEKRCLTEAFFCYIAAGDQASSVALQKVLFEEAINSQDWWYLDSLLELQAEAELLPFIRPLPRTEQFFLLLGLVHRIRNKRDEALLDYQQALNINPVSVLAYVSRGTTHAERDDNDKALADYNAALRIERNFAPAYLSRGVIYSKQGKYKEALRDNSKAMQLGLNTDTVFISRGNILNELGQYEDALVACDAALRLNPDVVDGYIGKGQALNGLEHYDEALRAYESALRLNPSAIDAHIGKGQTLNQLQRYEDALVAYNTAIRLNPAMADAYRGKGKALSGLKRYEEATAAYEQADRISPLPQEDIVEYEDIDDDIKPQRPTHTERVKDTGPVTFFGRLTRAFHTTRRPARRNPRLFWRGVNNAFALVAISVLVIALALISSTRLHSTLVGGVNSNATATSTLAPTDTPGLTATPTTATKITFNDPLTSDTNNNWDVSSNCAFKNNSYHVLGSQNNILFSCLARATNFSIFAYQVDMTIISGDGGGVVFCVNAAGSSYYYFGIRSNGQYELYRYNNHQATTLIQPTVSSLITTGQNQQNTIAVADGVGQIIVYINGSKITSIQDTQFSQGMIGVAAIDLTNAADVSFSNAKVVQNA